MWESEGLSDWRVLLVIGLLVYAGLSLYFLLNPRKLWKPHVHRFDSLFSAHR